MIVDALAAAGLGLALGVVTGMPLAVINVAVVEAASAGRVKWATRVGIGGAIADTVHATLAFIGVGELVLARPAWVRLLAAAAAIAVVAYAIAAWRRARAAARRSAAPSDAAASTPAVPPVPDDASPRGVLAGIAMTLPNPAALAAWAAVATAVWPDISHGDAVVCGLGVGVGSAAWFTGLAHFVANHRDHRGVRIASRVAVGILVVMALAGAVRAFLA